MNPPAPSYKVYRHNSVSDSGDRCPILYRNPFSKLCNAAKQPTKPTRPPLPIPQCPNPAHPAQPRGCECLVEEIMKSLGTPSCLPRTCVIIVSQCVSGRTIVYTQILPIGYKMLQDASLSIHVKLAPRIMLPSLWETTPPTPLPWLQ